MDIGNKLHEEGFGCDGDCCTEKCCEYQPCDKGCCGDRPEGHDFGWAINAVKQGAKVRRLGWNGKNQHIELASNISYKTGDGDVVNAEHDAIGNRAIAFCGTSGIQMGWLASQADMLAEDWEVAQ